jgi:hypothetical protein
MDTYLMFLTRGLPAATNREVISGLKWKKFDNIVFFKKRKRLSGRLKRMIEKKNSVGRVQDLICLEINSMNSVIVNE